MARRVVITGVGAVTGYGVGMARLWDGLCEGRSSIRPIARFDASGFPCQLAGEVENFSAKDSVPKHYRKAVKVMARDIELAVAAAKEAVEDAGLVTRGTLPEHSTDATTYPGGRMGCHIGAGLIAAEADELTAALSTARRADGSFDLSAWGKSGMDNLTPLWLLKYLPNMLSCHVTIIHGCEGPSNTITCAEASGLLSIGESMRVIERGDADLCFSGGAESKVNLMGLLRMDFAGRLAGTAGFTDGGEVVKPFDPDATGGLLGEAGGILILEELESARARGAKIQAEIAGCGAGHSPRRCGAADEPDEGFRFAIENALDDAGVRPDEVDAAVVLGSGVRTIDGGEAGALRAIFGSHLASLPLVTVGPNVGNCMAGIGSVQAAVGVRCITEQRLPARLNAGRPAQGVRAERAAAASARIGCVVVASGSLGGQNAAVVLRRLTA